MIRSNQPSPYSDMKPKRRTPFEVIDGEANAGARAQTEPPPSGERVAEPSGWDAHVVTPPSDWYTTAPPRREWLLRDRRTGDGVLPKGKVGQIIAEGGIGKTMVLCEAAVAITTGTPWLGALDVVSPGPVLALLGEEDTEEVQRRVYNAVCAMKVKPPPDGSFVVLPLAGVPAALLQRDPKSNAEETPFCHWLRGYIASRPWAAIFLDPLSRFAGPDAEKDNAQATRFVEVLENFTKGGATVLVAHHSNQQSRSGGPMTTTSGRGVTGLYDGVRWAATLGVETPSGEARDRFGELVTMSFKKSNYSKKGDPIVLRRDAENGGALVPLDDMERNIVETSRDRQAAQKNERQATENRARDEADDEKARATVAANPGKPKGDVVALVRAALGCGQLRAFNAVSRVWPANGGPAKPQAQSAEKVAQRAADEAQRIAARRQRDDEDDEAARRAIAADPDAGVTELVATVKKDRGCGTTRAHEAVTRARMVAR